MHSRWLINRTNPEYIQYLSKAASISPVLAQVLIGRGLKTVSDINDFLYPGVTGLSDPFELPSMKTAVERVKIALQRKERILVHGDYDADGLTATAIMLQVLRGIGLETFYFIPNRMLHGYGFHAPAVDMAKSLGARLIITVDCGITSLDAVSHANKSGIDVIITDHHEPLRNPKPGMQKNGGTKAAEAQEFLLPEAVAVINPKLKSPESELSILSGAGVALKFAQALAMEEGVPFSNDDVLPLFDLASLGTLADVVPLTGENRIILKEGLKSIQNGSRPGIRALKEVSGLNGKEMKAGRLSFTLVPRINAAGRVADAGNVVKLLLSEREDEAFELSAWLNGLNSDRQQIEAAVYQEAMEKLRGVDIHSAIVLAGEGWHQGVLGIVASRIAEEFYRPAFIFSVEDGVAKGSARSIPSFDLCKGLTETGGLLLSFGGHKQAAGIKLKAENIRAFEKSIKEIVQTSLDASDLQPVLEIDATIRLSEITHELVQEFSLLEPFGFGNPEPLTGAKALEVVSPRIVGDKHLKLRLKKESTYLDAIGFNMGGLLQELQGGPVDAVFTPAINDWNGGRYLQLVLKGLRPSA
ncbi:MAG: single-stranded-DNA-specific exonuclease RecJ [Nitrospiraceae bacterium]|nr:MAG: single-stranded-DNA-specific exonuclease RecJ [Nitrospiraceae bacterium]